MNKNSTYYSGNTLCIKIDGKDCGHEAYIRSLTTHTECGRIASAEILIDDGGLENEHFKIGDSEDFSIGREIGIYAGYEDAGSCLFKGKIEKRNIRLNNTDSLLTIIAKHPAFHLTQNRNTYTYENCTDKEIIEQICNKYGIHAKVENTAVTHEKMVQYHCSDWDFINLRAEAAGLCIFTLPDGIKAVRPSVNGDALNITNGYNLQQLDMEMDGRQAFSTCNAEAWNFITQCIESHSENGGQYDVSQGTASSAEIAEKNENDSQHLAMLSGMESNDPIQQMAKVQLMRNELSRITGNVQIWGYPLFPCDSVCFQRIGKQFNGTTIVSAVSHQISSEGWYTWLKVGLEATPFAEKFDNINATAADGQLAAVHGLQWAKVDAIEGDPLGEERICIRLINKENTRLWARIATPDAGNERGCVFLPEIDDEVVVGFINGNPNQAVVLGMLHGSQAPSPILKSDDNPLKGLVSREKIKLLFDDKKKTLTLCTPKNNSIVLNDEGGGIFIEDQNGNKITLDSNGICIETNKALHFKVTQDTIIESNNITVKANAQLKLQGQAGSELSASGNTVIKGALVQIN